MSAQEVIVKESVASKETTPPSLSIKKISNQVAVDEYRQSWQGPDPRIGGAQQEIPVVRASGRTDITHNLQAERSLVVQKDPPRMGVQNMIF